MEACKTSAGWETSNKARASYKIYMHDEFNNFLDVGCKWHPRKTKQPAMPSPSSSSVIISENEI
jgi:hypothetical protein